MNNEVLNSKGNQMKKQIITSIFLLAALMTNSAYAEGCLKGAVVGGVVGHLVGKHKLVGAVGGCVIGSHMAKKDKEKQVQAQQKSSNQPIQSNGQNQQQIITNSQINK